MSGQIRSNAVARGAAARVGRTLALALCVAAAGAPGAAMADQATAFPSTSSSALWTDLASAYADDTSYASVTSTTRNGIHTADFGTFGLGSIPASAINFVDVEVAWYLSDNATASDLLAQPVISGTPYGTALTDAARPTALVVRTQRYTGLALADLADGTFLVRVTYDRPNSTASQSAYLDYVKVTVDYTPSATPPSVPGSPVLSNIGATTVTATWTASATGTPPISYTVEKSLAGAGSWTDLAGCVAQSGTTCNGTGLDTNTSYDFRVVASNAGGSATSGTATQRTLPGQPVMAAYTNVAGTSVTVNWTMAGTTTGLTYAVERGPSATGPWTGVAGCGAIADPTRSCNDSSLSTGTTYWYQVRATNAAGSGAWATATSVVTASPPGVPGIPSAASPTTSSLSVSWTPASGTPTSYRLELATDTGYSQDLHVVDPATSPQSVTGLASNTVYYMRVNATGAGGTSAWSADGFGTTVPGAPGQPSFAGTTSSGTTVSWTAPSGNATITAYALDRATDSGFTQNLTTTPVGASTSTPVSGLAASTQYWFRVRATNAAGTSVSSTANSVTTSASAQTLLATGSDPTPSAPLCPGGEAAWVGEFAFSSSPTADTVSALDVALGAGAGAAVSLVEIRNASGGSLTPARSEVPASDTVTFGSASLPSPTGAGATYRLYVTPQIHSTVAPGSYGVAARVSSFTPATHPAQGSDSASTFTIDNAPLADAAWGTVTPGNNQIELRWTNPAADSGAAVSHVVVLRRRTSSAFTETLVDGAAAPGQGTTTAGGSYVVYSQTATAGEAITFVDSNVLNGNAYVYRVYVLDGCGNWNAGASAGPFTPAGTFVAEGSTVAGAPMISIVNPLKGTTVSGTFRMQFRVHNAVAQGGIAGTSGLAYSTDDGTSWQSASITALPGGTATGQTYEVHLTPAVAGPYTLRARVSNGVATDVLSNAVPIVFRTGGGSGTLLVRDNSSQLCSDCHALMGHTSETTASARGSWSTTCRDCHTPHGTKNIALVAESITPPAVTGPTTAKSVVFYNKTGKADASYASNAANGPCQVCHTRTSYYLSDGTGADHYTSPCASCHSHAKGLKATCTTCHGNEGRASIAGADPQQQAAPPVVATKDGQTVVAVTGGGAHVAHVNQSTLRAAPLACAQCHPWPNVHQETTQTDVLWSTLATSGGTTPSPAAGAVTTIWTSSPGCTNYCHGASLAKGGGSNRNPGWIGGPTHAACGTCHAVLPPVGGASAGVHPQNQACATCHGAGYGYALGAGSITDPAKADHIDGTLDRPNGCTACHGNLTGTSGVVVASGSAEAAPGFDLDSVDTRGSFDRADVGVGAHGKHVNAGMMSAKACGVCHGSTPVDGDEAHANATVAIGWSSPANAKSVAPTWTSPTCTNYCHSTGLPIGGTVVKATVTWTSTTPLGCGDCHAATPPTNAHAKHATSYGIGCTACHATTAATSGSIVAGGGAHVSGGNDVGFDGSDAYVAPAGYDPALYTCASSYCHSDGTDRNPTGGFAANTSRAWNAGSGGCTACHQAGTALATGSHPAHVNQAGTYATTYGCQTCHAETTTDGGSIASTTLHVNMAADVTPAATHNWVAGSCTTYCHSSGQATPQTYAATWGTPLANDCKQCHGRYSPADPGFTESHGAPNYVSGGTAAATANSHKKHVSSAADCYVCHESTANTTGDAIATSSVTHLDGSRQVDFNAAKAGASATYSNDANKRCSNVSCHGAGQPQWGGPAQACDSCHFGTNDAPDYASITNDVASVISSSEWSARGHGQGAGFEEFGAVTNRCVYCHDDQNASANHKQAGNPFRLRGAANASGATALYDASAAPDLGACLNCHAVSGANGVDPDGLGSMPKVGPASKRIDAYHYGATDHNATQNGGRRCWDCHDAHGDGANLAMIGSNELRAASDLHGFGGTRVSGVVLTTRGAGGYANNSTFDGVCQACHTTTDYWRASTAEAVHNVGTDCVSCHSHQQPPNNAFQGAGACSACHVGAASASADTDRNEFPPVYNGGGGKSFVDPEDWSLTGHGLASASTYRSGNPGAGFPITATVEGCYYCHAPDTALWASGESSKHGDVATTNPFRLLNTSGGTNKNGVCLVCHAPASPGFDPDGAAKTDYASINRTTSAAISAAHHGASHAAGDGGALCWDCHDAHGDWNYANGRPIAYMIQAQPSRATADAWGATITATTQVVDFDKALGVDAANFDGGDYVRAASPYTGVCQVCHTGTAHWTSTATDTHQNGGARCVACHAHEQTPDLAFQQVDATNNCGACHPAIPGGRHASHLSAAPSQTYGDTSFRSTPTDYDFGCGKCHQSPAAVHYDDQGGTASDPYRADVAFDLNNGSAAAYPAIVQPPTATQTGPTGLVFGWQNGTCSNTYCHDPLGASYAVGAGQKIAVSWNTTATLACTGCHDDGTSLASTALPGAHGQHVRLYANDGYQYGCEKCHDDTVSDFQTLRTTANQGRVQHVDGDKNDVRFNASPISQVNGAFSGGTSGTCSNTYCHSNGQDLNAADGFVSTSIAWNTTGSCTSCHGGGGGASTTLTVSHDTHVLATASGGYAYDCDRCHNATGSGSAITNKANHVDADATHDVAFNSLPIAQTLGTYDPAAKTCSSTYCHSNGQDTSSPFTSGPSVAWGTSADCTSCHAGGNASSTTLSGAHGKHVNATASGGYNYSCEKCHTPTVSDSFTFSNKANHVDADTATHDVDFSAWPLDQTAATYSVTNQNCTSTYCHSPGTVTSAPFGNVTSIAWSAGGGCAHCHASPPANPEHVYLTSRSLSAASECNRCHSTTISAAGAVVWSAGVTQHVDGNVDATLTCHSCHGSTTNDAPPVAANAANGDAVGSHQSHVTSGNVADGMTCAECHGTAYQTYANTHADGNAATSFGTTLSTGTVWTGNGNATSNCATSYCHGASAVTPTGASVAQTYWGGVNKTPLWNVAAGSIYQQCNACHGAAPPLNANSPHPPNTACAGCHGTGYATSGITSPALATHVDRTVQWTNRQCTSCHGDSTVSVASGEDGRIAPGFNANAQDAIGQKTGTAAVGAHQAHLLASRFKNNTVPATCTSCHPSPMPTNTAHATGAGTGGARASVPFGAFAKTGGLTPTYGTSTTGSDYTTGATAGACSSTYCHGGKYTAAEYQGTNQAPSWTAGAAAAACGTCHKAPPTSAGHGGVTVNTNCIGCHTGYDCVPSNSTACVLPSNHIDGVGDGPGSCIGCHGAQQDGGSIVRARIVGLTTVSTNNTDGDDFIRPSRHVSDGSGTEIVTDLDCIVCHAEGETSSTLAQPARSALHANGETRIDLRDVDSSSGSGVAAKWPGQRQAAFTASAYDRDQMDWFCLGCHDGDGAAGISVNSGTTGFDLSPAIVGVSISRTTTTVTVGTGTTPHGLVAGDAVNLTSAITNATSTPGDMGTTVEYKPGIKLVASVPTTTSFTYLENAPAALASRAVTASFRRYVPAVPNEPVALSTGGWTSANAASGTVTFAGGKAKDPGANRVLLVAITGNVAAASTTAPTCTATYGGQAQTAVYTSGTTSSRVKTCILVFNEAAVAAATGTPPALSATIAAGTIAGARASAAFYTGVHQTTPVSASNGAAGTAAALGAAALSTNAAGTHVVAYGGGPAATVGVVPVAAAFHRQFTMVNTNAALDVFHRNNITTSSESITVTYTWNGTTIGSALVSVALNPAAAPASAPLSRSGSTVTVNTVTNHGFANGETVALTPGHDLFRGGWKTITVTSPTQFTYTEAGTAGSIPRAERQYFVRTAARASTPFNPSDTLQNARETAGHEIRAWRATNNKVVNVKSQFNSGNLVGSEFASHHNLNQFAKRYAAKALPTGATGSWSAYTTKDGVALNSATAGVGGEVAGLHCSDCHLNETNAHGTRNTWYMLASSTAGLTTENEPFDVAVSGVGTTNYNGNCARCHPSAVYQATATARSRSDHADCARQADDPLMARLGTPYTTAYQINTLPCLGCHGGRGDTNLGPGLIHGTNETYSPGQTGTSKMYRFMGSGASYPYYTPDQTAAAADWARAGNATCYNNAPKGTSTAWGGCSQHTSIPGQATPLTQTRGATNGLNY